MQLTLTVTTASSSSAGRPQAVKVMEEAAEMFAARDMVQKAYEQKVKPNVMLHLEGKLADEIADVLISACGLAARWNLDLQAALDRKAGANKERGY